MTQRNTPSNGIRPLYVLIIAAIAFGLGAGAGVFVWINISGGSGEASRDVQDIAPTLPPLEPTVVATQEAEATTEAVATSEAETAPVTTMEAEGNPVATAEAEATEEAQASVPGDNLGSIIFRIVPEQSEARFVMQEDLRGARVDVIGVTKDVAGDIRVDFANPAASQVGGIVINARTLTTDQQFRNQALRGQILRSADDKYEFITFTPTALSGFSETDIAVGDSVTFQLTGDLKIIEVTKSVTFEVTVTVDSETQITGSGKTTVLYKDFNITIPSVPGVANITDEVSLEIDFVAAAVQ